ncbi:coagulation factor XI-like [Corythoichthys intestinalis]|uniref:coagulation factor XI-like n=1 Tax=Corythoichthys intestinalis TaxID=161448 RepID=UPI0025A66A76|nr:coagulation factor XI-like [Corythoichthys intestinalis]XP_061808732.1 coagulation factor XI-like [Nerophis lumbriciformis]
MQLHCGLTEKMGVYFILISVLTFTSLSSSQECTRELLENVDFPGTDIKFEYSPDARHCQHLCTQHPSCLFFTFVRPEWTTDNRHFYCYLKSTPSGEPNKKTALIGVTSGYSLKPCGPDPQPCLSRVYQNVDFLGADYRTLFTADYQECQRVCTKDPFCQFFTFVNPVFTPEKIRYKCHLKFSWPLPRTLNVNRKNGVVSGFSHSVQLSQFSDTECSVKLFPNTDTMGGAFESQPAGTPEQCLAICSAHPKCFYFSFQSNDFTCKLKDNPNDLLMKSQQGVTSGIATHHCQQPTGWANVPLEGVDFQGSDILFELMDDAETCQKRCTIDQHCQFYTYVNETFGDPVFRRRCYLKRTTTMPAPPKITKLANVVSGFTMRNCI